MTKDDKRTLTPRLRFPEFRDAPGWVFVPMGDLISLEYGESLPEQSRRAGSVPVMGSNGIVGYHEEALIKGPAIVIGRKGSVGQVTWSDSDCFPIDTTFYVENKKPSKISILFLYRLLQVSALENRRAPGAVPGLNRNEVHSLGTAIPKPAEQQKIADSLTCLDELIGGQGRKVEALKVHKQGLMQRLFPRAGETLPRLRFPEFRDTPDWERRKMGSLLEKVSQPAEVEANRTYREIGIRSHGKGIFHKGPVAGAAIGAKRVFHVVPGAFILNIIFAWEQAVAFTSEKEAGMIASHRFPMYLPRSRAGDVRFLAIAFLTPIGKHLLGQASPGGAGRNRTLGQNEFEKLEIVVPTVDEQARIADAVLAADAAIAAEAGKLAAFKTHKRGLMRQLFPSPEGD
ncbi:MAG TPA: restriction endonuclease subunit S [Pirellulales bacterium]